MHRRIAWMAAAGLLAAAALADGGHVAVSARIGAGCAPPYFGPYGYGLALHAPVWAPVVPGGVSGAAVYAHGGYGYPAAAAYGYRSYGYRVVSPRSYVYAHRGYDRYAYRYGQYHYPGRHYVYSYGYRFYAIDPHAAFGFRGAHDRDDGHRRHAYIRDYRHGGSVYYGHPYRGDRGHSLRHRATFRRHIIRRGHHR